MLIMLAWDLLLLESPFLVRGMNLWYRCQRMMNVVVDSARSSCRYRRGVFDVVFPVPLFMDGTALNAPHVRFPHPMQWQTIYPFGMVS